MLNSEVRQLELLSSIDDLRRQVDEWIEEPSEWEPVRRSQSLLKRVLDRVETLRVRMEAPLVVATFGGTGTGKSSLINALVGEEVSRSGRERPTTHRPVLIAHPRTDLSLLKIPLEEVELVQRDADLLRDVVLLDCPDPDTNEEDVPGSNVDRLRNLLPYCDVLLYVSTQQKYRSARVTDELKAASGGCRIIFVQTHADLDEDIREDWKKTLIQDYEIPELYFVDSSRALKEQQQGIAPTGEFGQLMNLLLNKLGASERVRIRRVNFLELLSAGLSRCQEILAEKTPELGELNQALLAQRQSMSEKMALRLQSELLGSHRLWERRLISAVIDQWGMSPFAGVLRIYYGLGSILASTALFRARSTAQLALLGGVQGVRWLEGRRKEQAAETSLQRVSQFGLDDAMLRESEIVISGHVQAAGFSHDLLRNQSLSEIRNQAAAVEEQFVGDASRRIDRIIEELSVANSRWWIRIWYEVILTAYLTFVLARVGKNFFYDSLVLDKPLLTTDFYLAAGLFLLLCCGLLVLMFTRRLQRGLTRSIRDLVSKLVETKLSVGLFPTLEASVREVEGQQMKVHQLLKQTELLRHDVARIGTLGGKHRPVGAEARR
ncbi:dynamin family protein [Planctomicrobium sp. SH661]|uniref:dynamin family protein n=1 Tax=Planctomicrobium sp. SH661 TaxID=3448124 RepID=UPI003F5B206F